METVQGMVSVVIPYFNRQECIVASLKSVLNQTYENLEVIIVDDGSKESIENILTPYLGERVRYHRYTPNRGVSHARNVGVSLARGEYIAFHDSDDFCHQDRIEQQMNYLYSGNYDMVICGMNRISALSGESYYSPREAFDEKGNAVEQLLCFDCVGTVLLLLNQKTVQKISFDESLRKFEDGDYALQAAMSGAKIGYLPKALIDSEVQSDSLTVNVNSGPAREKIYRKYESEYRKYPKSHARFLEDMARNFKSADPKKSARYLRQSLRIQFTFKRLVKYLLTIAGVLK